MNIDLNADAGESFGAFRMGRDLELFDFISTVNVACGFHAGDPLTMQATLELAKQKNVAVGAHPGYQDLVGFGRRILEATPEQVYADTVYQVAALAGFAKLAGIKLSHVKAHGALSTRAWVHAPTAEALARATQDFDPNLPLMVLPGTFLKSEAQKLNVPMLIEAFPERAYMKDGRLAPRSMAGSSIHDPKVAARRAVMMVKEHRVEAIDGGWFEMQPQTLCIHGDNPHAPEIAKEVRAALEAEGITISNAGL
jgi:5-oxoprolinase (ATP-hydrolysing) subunit A